MRGVVMDGPGTVRVADRDGHLHGGPAPVRRFLRELIELNWEPRIDPGKVFDPTLPLEQAAEGYRAMDERRATKVVLTS